MLSLCVSLNNRKQVEFDRAETRVTGIASRLLYQFAMWKDAIARHRAQAEGAVDGDVSATAAVLPAYKVYIEGNGFAAFTERCAQACSLMGFQVLSDSSEDDDNSQNKHAADLVFIYIAPPGEARVDGQYATFQSVVDHRKESGTSVDNLPMLCFLLGEADFLEPPEDDEAERLRGLSEFAISQQLHPRMQDAKFASVAQFAVEFTPEAGSADQEVKQVKLEQLMTDFGCVDHNIMHYTEKWEFYAHQQSALCQDAAGDDELTQPSDDEALFWLEYAKDKTCHFCHVATGKLSRCARCQDARYCSRECQRAAWKFHKRLCGKTPEEISSSE